MTKHLNDRDRSRHCDVCVCDTPRFTGPCNCDQKRHAPGECRACHRPYGPTFTHIRDAWRARLLQEVS